MRSSLAGLFSPLRVSLTRLALVPAALSLAACVPDLTIPDGGMISCTSNDDCRETETCEPTTNLCVDPRRANEVTSQPTIELEDGRTALKNDDLVTVGGGATAGSAVFSVRLLTSAGAEISSLAPELVAVDASGVLSGGFVASGLTDGERVVVEVVVVAGGSPRIPWPAVARRCRWISSRRWRRSSIGCSCARSRRRRRSIRR